MNSEGIEVSTASKRPRRKNENPRNTIVQADLSTENLPPGVYREPGIVDPTRESGSRRKRKKNPNVEKTETAVDTSDIPYPYPTPRERAPNQPSLKKPQEDKEYEPFVKSAEPSRRPKVEFPPAERPKGPEKAKDEKPLEKPLEKPVGKPLQEPFEPEKPKTEKSLEKLPEPSNRIPKGDEPARQHEPVSLPVAGPIPKTREDPTSRGPPSAERTLEKPLEPPIPSVPTRPIKHVELPAQPTEQPTEKPTRPQTQPPISTMNPDILKIAVDDLSPDELSDAREKPTKSKAPQPKKPVADLPIPINPLESDSLDSDDSFIRRMQNRRSTLRQPPMPPPVPPEKIIKPTLKKAPSHTEPPIKDPNKKKVDLNLDSDSNSSNEIAIKRDVMAGHDKNVGFTKYLTEGPAIERENEPRHNTTGTDDDPNLEREKFYRSQDAPDGHLGKPKFSKSSLAGTEVFMYMTIPPDGGFGWVIVFTSFLCQTIVDGILFSFGILLPKISEDFGLPMTVVLLLSSVQMGCYFLSGALASAFVNAYGFRPVGIFGSVLAILSIFISTFSHNIFMSLFFYSMLAALGMAFIWVASQLVIGFYFEKYRPIANGVSCAGAGFGITIFCYMNYVLLPIIGWRNISRIHSALLIIVLGLCFTFISIPPTKIGQILSLTNLSYMDDEDIVNIAVLATADGSIISIELSADEEYIEEFVPEKNKNKCQLCFQRCCRKRKSVSPVPSTETLGRKSVVLRIDPINRRDLFYTGRPSYEDLDEDTENHDAHSKSARHTLHMDRRTTTFNDNSLKAWNKLERGRQRNRRCKTPEWCKKLNPGNWVSSKVKRAFTLLFDVSIFKEFEFRVFFTSAFLFFVGLNIPFIYSRMRANLDEAYMPWLTPTIGVSNFLFRIISGLIAYKLPHLTSHVCGYGIAFGGLAVFISAFYGADIVWFQFTYAACYGVAPAFYSTLRAIIYVRTLGLERLTACFGFTAIAMGAGVFTGTTIGGVLRELTGGYTFPFAFAGLMIMISGMLKAFLPMMVAAIRRRELLDLN